MPKVMSREDVRKMFLGVCEELQETYTDRPLVHFLTNYIEANIEDVVDDYIDDDPELSKND